MKKNFKFSIVMPIYNVEEYLEEAIRSILDQNIGFEKNIQLILVNDGSVDGSHAICNKYLNIYPENIVYLEQENRGVSSARNKAIKYVEGEYVNFLDPDDKLQNNALSSVYEFFRNNHDKIDVVAIPQYFFEGKQGPHQLIYKFKENRIVNINDDYDYIQLSVTSSFIKREALNIFQFDETMNYSEDVHLLTRIILEKFQYGLVCDTKHLYRKRLNNSSALQTASNKKEWYLEHIQKLMIYLINYSINKCGYVPKYVQYLCAYDLQWKLHEKNISNRLSENEKKDYIEALKEVLQYIDDSIIIEQKFIDIEYKLFCLKLKNNTLSIEKELLNNNIIYKTNGINIYELKNYKIWIEFIKIKENMINIEGYIPKYSFIDDNKMRFMIEYKNLNIEPEYFDCKYRDIYSLDNCILHNQYFRVSIPIDYKDTKTKFKFILKYRDLKMQPKVDFNLYVKLQNDLNNCYFVDGGKCIIYNNCEFSIIKNNIYNRLQCEIKYLKEVFKHKGKSIFMIRILMFFLSELKKKQMWVFMDRLDKADDNAEHLFRYALTKNDNIKKYYIINESSKDFRRLKKIGKVIPYGTYKQKLYMLLCDKIISSHIDIAMRNPVECNGRPIKSLSNSKFVFLQHGITKDDMSNWLNKYNKNIDLFITSSNKEYESILSGNYYYDKNIVKCTGFPRYDKLQNNSQKKIIIMPTWRNGLINEVNMYRKREYNPKFKESDYFKQFDRLINDKKLIEECKKMGYELIFFPHPNVQVQLKDFHKNDYVKFEPYDTSYNELFCTSSLLITDYSSVAFDFAYMKKPIIYYQFDYNEIFKKDNFHIYIEGYFDYRTMGFGPIAYKYNDLIDNIIKIMKNHCIMEEKYKERVKSFYRYTDDKNCERVYNEILEMDK